MRSFPRVQDLLVLLLSLVPAPARGPGRPAVYSEDGIDVLAAGDGGAIYRSFDGGSNWAVYTLGSLALRDLAGTGNRILAVSDSGKIWVSADRGGNWGLTVLAGAPDLLGAAWTSPDVAHVVGAGGTIVKTTDAGATWEPRTSGTVATLRAVAFADTAQGWAVGDDGAVLHTTDGGEAWNPVALGTPNDLFAVSQRGAEVWVVGARGTAFRSMDGGANFSPVRLKLDARSAVRAVRVLASGAVWLAGGGGFIRRTSDGGATWTFMQHRIHAPITDLEFFGTSVWATNSRSPAVTYSIDDGGFWRLPIGASVALSWGGTAKYPFVGTVRGSTLGQSPVLEDVFYCALGNKVVRSADAGETWQDAANLPATVGKVNAFLISPKDTSLWLAAVGGGTIADRILRSTDAGVSWTATLIADFGEYGIPLEMDPDHPDTVLFGGESSASGSPTTTLRRSKDFGATWDPHGTTEFRSPCDLVIIPDSTNVIVLGDGVTGSGRGEFWKSTDGGESFTMVAQMPAGASEIPGMANSRLNKGAVFGTNWGSGGVRRSTDYGSTWAQVDATGSAWGIDVARDDPNVVMFGRYSGASSLMSTNGGATWTSVAVPMTWGNNYGMFLRDRGTILCEQSGGIWKLAATYNFTPASTAQSLVLLAPNSGEVLSPGAQFTVRWSAQQIALARVEYRRGPNDPWQWVGDRPGYYNAFVWTVPFDGTSQAQIRVRDAWDGAPVAVSSGTFTILAPHVAVTPPALDFGAQTPGSSTALTVTLVNDGAATLNLGSLTTGTSAFHPGRDAFQILAGQQDTVGVWFEPPGSGSFEDTLVIVSDDLAHTPIRVPLSGGSPGGTLTLLAPNGGESWQYATSHAIAWAGTGFASVDLDYRVHPDSAWVAIAAGLPPAPASYDWTIPFAPTTAARVRVRGDGGALEDASDAAFSLTSPRFVCGPDTLRLPVVIVGGSVGDTLHIENPGTAPLTISAVTTGNPEFWPGRTTLIIPPGGSDTLGIYYEPTAEGRDTTDVTILADSPFAPYARVVTGFGGNATAAGARGVASFALFQNLPNPFRGGTTIRYALPAAADVSLEVFDLRGHRVATLVRGRQTAGPHAVEFGAGARTADGARLDALRSGVYFYRLQSGGRFATRKMLLIQ